MTRKDLSRAVSKSTPLTVRKAENLVIALGAVITEALASDKKVIYSNFGTFYICHYPSKTINHPKFGILKKFIMLPTNVIKWMPAEGIKKLANGNEVPESPTMHKSTIIKKPSVVEKPINSDNDLETYLASKNREVGKEPVSIYDEILKDGSHEFSTVSGTIKAHRAEEKPINPYANKVSLADAGIFDKESTIETKLKTIGHGEERVNQIKNDIKKESDDKDLTDAVQNRVNIQYQDLSNVVVDKALLSRIPEKIAHRYKAVPVEEKENAVTVAMVDPEDIETKEIFKRLLGNNIIIKLTTESDINHVLSQYQGLESEVSSAIATADEDEVPEKKKKTDQDVENQAISDDAPAARIVTSLLKRAIRDKASDIHIEPSETKVEVRFRLDGVLHKKVTLPKEIQAAVISRIKILSNLKIDEQRVPQDGRFNLLVDDRKVDFRVSTMPIANGEKVVMRILDKESGVLTIEQLGIEGEGKKIIEQNLTKSHGMVLVTGPTGSGKTTTLYAMVTKIFYEGVNIVTLEDPIEYQIKGINQSQVNSEIGYTFANGLRSILRQDPDIIMLGEIRDKETAEMAVHAALTGHVVLSTLHTNNAAGAIPRLIDMGVEPFLLTSSINVVIGQRLVRNICATCKEEVKLTEEEIKTINEEIEKMPAKEKEVVKAMPFNFFKGKGCKICENSGYKSRVGIYEVLGVSEEIKNLVLKRVPSSQIETVAVAEGMLTMVQDGIKKALLGATTIEEVWRVTRE